MVTFRSSGLQTPKMKNFASFAPFDLLERGKNIREPVFTPNETMTI